MARDPAGSNSVISVSTAASQQTTKAGLRRLKKQICNKFWDYVDDFSEWRCLSRSDNVWMVRCKTSRGLLCIQSFPKASIDARLRLYRMVLIFDELVEQIPFVLKIYDVVEDKGALLICSEFCPRGTLCDALEHLGCVSNLGWLVCEALVPLMIVLHHMHSSGAVHRNVTPSCVWFHKDGSARIGGLELASQLSDVVHRDIVGSLEFVAPEMLLCSAPDQSDSTESLPNAEASETEHTQVSYSYSVDVWSLGVTTYLCLTGMLPFNGGPEDDAEVLFQNILLSEPEYPEDMDAPATDFVRACLAKQPADRPDMKELLAHPFVQQHLNWERAPSERTPDAFYEIPPEEISPDASAIGTSRWRRIFSRSAWKFPKAVVLPEAAATAASASTAQARSAAVGAAGAVLSGFKKRSSNHEPGYITYQSRISTQPNAMRHSAIGHDGPQLVAGQDAHGSMPRWKHFPSTAHVEGLPRASLDLVDAATKSHMYDRTIAAVDASAVNRVESAGPGPLTPADRVEAWECGTTGASPAADGGRSAQQVASSSTLVPSALLGGDSVIQIPAAGGSGGDVRVPALAAATVESLGSAGASAAIHSPRTMAANNRWSVKWVNSWTGDTSPRSPLTSPRNPPPADAGASGRSAPVATVVADAGTGVGSPPADDAGTVPPVAAEQSAEVVGVGRRGLVELGDADDGTVMWSRSVPRTPASAVSAASLSGVVAEGADGAEADLEDAHSDEGQAHGP